MTVTEFVTGIRNGNISDRSVFTDAAALIVSGLKKLTRDALEIYPPMVGRGDETQGTAYRGEPLEGERRFSRYY